MGDSIREKVYAAETWVTGITRWTSARDAAAFIRYMERHVAFKDRYPDHKPVSIFKLRREANHSSAFYRPANHGVYLPYWAQNQLTLVHELTHGVTRNVHPSHGAVFVRHLHWMVATMMSERQADELAQGFEANGIRALAYTDAGRLKDLGNTSK